MLTWKWRAYGVDYYWRGQHILTSGKFYVVLVWREKPLVLWIVPFSGKRFIALTWDGKLVFRVPKRG